MNPQGILIASGSGRALAEAARKAGFAPLVADLFGDADARAASLASRRAGDWREGFAPAPLLAALEALAADGARLGAPPVGLVYGAGFEDRPELVAAMAARWPRLGNAPDVLRRAKDPESLAALCRALAVPHPARRRTRPDAPEGWLAKAQGGAGGTHVVPAAEVDGAGEAEGVYFQRRVGGAPVGVAVLGDGREAIALGASRQWTAPAPHEPFRYGGCARPAGLPAPLDARLRAAALAMARALGLKGLNSVDFLVEGEAFHLIEVNPRPGATLDVYDAAEAPLMGLHVEACRGRLPRVAPIFSGAAAAAIAYAPREIAAMPALDWPDWAADRQSAASFVGEHEPICTVTARAGEPFAARTLVEERSAALWGAIEKELGERRHEPA
ncbi:ATP-grasp domain-containing protein [Methylocella sp.]|uniref:ATP-grasp domain-containing protein n=1 Tax=Methylocella sp. TaxID=1978226 RepID=UPI0037832E67